MKNSALNWIDDEGYCGYPTARVNELYDGIVTALEDMADDPDYEELFDE